jgi:hypothetical protein
VNYAGYGITKKETDSEKRREWLEIYLPFCVVFGIMTCETSMEMASTANATYRQYLLNDRSSALQAVAA